MLVPQQTRLETGSSGARGSRRVGTCAFAPEIAVAKNASTLTMSGPQSSSGSSCAVGDAVERNGGVDMVSGVFEDVVEQPIESALKPGVSSSANRRFVEAPFQAILEPSYVGVSMVDVNGEAHQVIPEGERQQHCDRKSR
jgi:hypothetical protein